jgi:hypothetical protein
MYGDALVDSPEPAREHQAGTCDENSGLVFRESSIAVRSVHVFHWIFHAWEHWEDFHRQLRAEVRWEEEFAFTTLRQWTYPPRLRNLGSVHPIQSPPPPGAMQGACNHVPHAGWQAGKSEIYYSIDHHPLVSSLPALVV